MKSIYITLCCFAIVIAACSNTGKSENKQVETPKPPPVDSVAKADSILGLNFNEGNWKQTMNELARWDKCKSRQIDSCLQFLLTLDEDWPQTASVKSYLPTLVYGGIFNYARGISPEYDAYLHPKQPPQVVPDYRDITEKPVIYIYPTTEQNITVKLGFKGTGLFTWPKIIGDSMWAITATPGGMLKDASGEEYPYLFWEGEQADIGYINQTEGFIVKGAEVETFLTEKLKLLGLNARERTDFITYWAPRMKDNEYNFVRFETEAYAKAVPLNIAPQPASTQRILMAFKAVDESYAVSTQTLTPFTRSGYTVIEWGGIELQKEEF